MPNVLDLFTPAGDIFGPVAHTGTQYQLLTAGQAKLLSPKGLEARLWQVNVETPSTLSTVNVYEGEDRTAPLVAAINCSARKTFWFAGARLPGGLFVSLDGGSAIITVIASFAPPHGDVLTLSGNEITDVTRNAAVSWGTGQQAGSVDQFTAPDSSYGIWEAGTNLFRRGQCDALTDWTKAGAGTVTTSLDATKLAPFGPQSVKAVTDGTAGSQGIIASSNTGLAAATGTVGVGSIYFLGVSGQSYQVHAQWVNTDLSTTDGARTTFNATGQWQLLTPASVAVAAALTGDKLQITAHTNGLRAETLWFAHAMLQSGVNVVSPYIATSGGASASRNIGRVQAPASLLNITQGWAAMRVRLGWDSTYSVANTPKFLSWRDDSSNRIMAYCSGSKFAIRRAAGVSQSDAQTAAQTINVGDIVTIVFAWTGTQVGVSFNGGSFARVANTFIPALAASTWEIGSETALNTATNGDILWCACGIGTLADADAATINGFGSNDMLPSYFPGNCTMVWPANTSRYYTP